MRKKSDEQRSYNKKFYNKNNVKIYFIHYLPKSAISLIGQSSLPSHTLNIHLGRPWADGATNELIPRVRTGGIRVSDAVPALSLGRGPKQNIHEQLKIQILPYIEGLCLA